MKTKLPLSEKYALTMSEAAQYVSISANTLRDACKRGDLPYSIRCRKMLVKRIDLENWIDDKAGSNRGGNLSG